MTADERTAALIAELDRLDPTRATRADTLCRCGHTEAKHGRDWNGRRDGTTRCHARVDSYPCPCGEFTR